MASLKDLQETARELGIEGRSNMNKNELEGAIYADRVQRMLDNNSLDDLHEAAAREEIDGRSSMNKDELAEALVSKMMEDERESEEDRDTPADTPSALRNLPDTEPPPEEVAEEVAAEPEAPVRQLEPRRSGGPRVGVRGEVRGSRARQGPVPRQRTIGKTAR